jgi:quercetin dioxygenase-like cupin family protein
MLSVSRVSLFALLACSFVAVADEPKRVVLERHDLSGDSKLEVVIGTAMLPPGTAIGFHTHAGDEIGYVVKGSIIRKVKGEPDKTLNAGDSFFNPRGVIHSVAAAPGGEGGTVVSTWIVEKGKPLGTPGP